MTAWWYAEKDNKIGPIEIEEIKRLLQVGRITKNTMIWREGMDVWMPFDQVEEFDELKAVVPPPLPRKADEDPLNYPMAKRWTRFFARMFDVWWELLLVSILLELVLDRNSASFIEWFNKPGSGQLFAILCLPIALVLDAIIFKLFGNTPGKAFIGLKVGKIDGKPLSFDQYLNRNFLVWRSGLALGVPLFNLYTMSNQSGRVGKGQQATYDESTGFRVRSKPSGWVRKTAFGLAFASLFFIMAGLNVIGQEHERETILSSAQKNYAWENPITLITASIEPKWKPTVEPTNDGKQAYMFTERSGHAIVILAKEDAPNYSLDDYLNAFKKSTSATMKFSDGDRYFQKGNHSAWQGNGNMIDISNPRLKAEVVQIGSAFWRVVTVQAMPYDFSDSAVEKIQTELWGTVK